MDVAAVLLVGVAMAIAIVGTLFPLLPGLPLAWAAALGYGVVTGFGRSGWIAFGAITAVAAVGLAVGTLLPHQRVAAAGVARSSIVAGVIGGLVGFFVVPVIGLPVGAATAILVAERQRVGAWDPAWDATKKLLVGFGLGVLVQFAAALLVAVIWVAWVVQN